MERKGGSHGMINIFYKYNNKILTFTIPSNLFPIIRNTRIQGHGSRAFIRRISRAAAAGNGTANSRYGNSRNCCSGGPQGLLVKSIC
jgi:hypothetical protein